MTRYAQEYERLRCLVNAASAERPCAAATPASRGIGLALLLRDGVPAWIQAVRQVLSLAAASAAGHAGAASSPWAPAVIAPPASGADGRAAGNGVPSSPSALLDTGRQHDLTALLASLVLSARRAGDAAPIKEPSPCH